MKQDKFRIMFAQSAATHTQLHMLRSFLCFPRLLDKLETFPLAMIINEGYESSQLFGKTRM